MSCSSAHSCSDMWGRVREAQARALLTLSCTQGPCPSVGNQELQPTSLTSFYIYCLFCESTDPHSELFASTLNVDFTSRFSKSWTADNTCFCWMVLGGTLRSLAVIPLPAFSQHCLCTQLPFTCAVGFLGTTFCEILCTSSPSLLPVLLVWKADKHT